MPNLLVVLTPDSLTPTPSTCLFFGGPFFQQTPLINNLGGGVSQGPQYEVMRCDMGGSFVLRPITGDCWGGGLVRGRQYEVGQQYEVMRCDMAGSCFLRPIAGRCIS